ncbi:MAG: superinfection immunity protein [Candidatus Puniceispirillales bacterium WSBS_2018_MAG_OTU23]
MEIILIILSLFLVLLLFFLPTIVASYREHKRTGGVILLNILVGWTGLGWILLLTYSLLSEAKEK